MLNIRPVITDVIPLELEVNQISTAGKTSQFIRCLGCQSVANASASACAACGRCLNCGIKRTEPILECPKCSTPLCDCCRRCFDCGESPDIDLTPCDCGHPNNKQALNELIERHGLSSQKPKSIALAATMIIILGIILLGVMAIAITS